MSYIVWNERGLGNQRALKRLYWLVTGKDLSLVFLCENKLVTTQYRSLKAKLGCDCCYVPDSEGRKRWIDSFLEG